MAHDPRRGRTDEIVRQARPVRGDHDEIGTIVFGGLQDLVKLTVYLLDLGNFQIVNEVMAERFSEPYPARAAIGVAGLPKDAAVEVEAIMVIPG